MKFWNFYDNLMKGLIPNRISEDQIENEFRSVLIDLKNAKSSIIVKFLPAVFNCLLTLLSEPPIVAGRMLNIGQSVFEVLSLILHNLAEFAKKERFVFFSKLVNLVNS